MAEAATMVWKYTGGYYYFYIDNVMQKGWASNGYNWYYLDPSTGRCQFGWKKISGDWYYLIPENDSGRAAMGWLKIAGGWYYFDPTNGSGRMQMGWKKINGAWFYLNPVNESGAMMTGWQWLYDKGGEHWFYFRPGDDGRMVGGNQVIDGIEYRFGTLGSATEGQLSLIQTWDLVDAGKHLDVDGNSKYMSYIWKGMNIWNGYKPGVIRRDSLTVAQDLYVTDIDQQNMASGATSSDGKLKLNVYYLKNETENTKTHIATHELGHALGLAHTPTSGNMMWGWISGVILLSQDDKTAYDRAYKNY
ncbi:MAG: M57 family metalloprotease [Propionibacteriaceae bacterium]|nr:M57 family metalloprotease [Propionibacteriaceae bacterium]